MPLEDFLSEVMNLLESQPGAGEILVEGVKFLRYAEARDHGIDLRVVELDVTSQESASTATGTILKESAGIMPGGCGCPRYWWDSRRPCGPRTRRRTGSCCFRHPVGLDYWIWPGRPGGLGSSLSDLLGRVVPLE